MLSLICNKLVSNMAITEENSGKNMLSSMASELLTNKNRIAKAISAFIRNKIEDFHVEFTSDSQMREINPLIRNAVFTFLYEYESDYSSIATLPNEKLCSKYILNNTIPYLKSQSIPEYGIKQFKKIIIDAIGLPFTDLANGGLMLAGYEWLYVPKYWEDCVYCDGLKTMVDL